MTRTNIYDFICERTTIDWHENKPLHEYLTPQEQNEHLFKMQNYFGRTFTLDESNYYFDITHCIMKVNEQTICRITDDGEFYDDVDVTIYNKYTGEDGKNYLYFQWQDIEQTICLALFN